MTEWAQPWWTRRGGDPAGRSGPRRVLIALCLIMTSLAAAACTSPRDVLGPAASPCYRAVAVARLAVHRQGRFSGVQSVSGTTLTPVLRRVAGSRHAHFGYGPKTALCLVAYRGHFRANEVERGVQRGGGVGQFAVVVVRELDERVVTTIVLQKPPIPLTRVFPVLR